MRSMLRRLASAVLVGSCFVIWSPRTEDIVAQQRTSIIVTRLYTGPDGQAYAEDVELKLRPSSRTGSEHSETIKVTGVSFGRMPPGTFNDWHRAPLRQYVITLSGRREIEV